MNVLIVCKLANDTLTDNVLLPVLNSNADDIYVLRDFPGNYSDPRVHYLTPKKAGKSVLRHIGRTFKGIRAVRKYKIGAIIGILSSPHGYIGRTISQITGKPYIHMTIAGHREYWVDGPRMEKFNLRYLTGGKAVTVTGGRTKEYLLGKGVEEKKIFILPNLPNRRFASVPLQTERYYDIVSFSRIDKNKNLILLVKALAKLKEKLNIKVAVAGDGDQLDNIKAAVESYGLDKNFDFLGYISDVDKKIEVLSNSKIFVSCSKGEGFPIALLEAAECGCVPVVSDVGDISDIVASGHNGIVFNDTDNESELVSSLEILLTDNEKLLLMREESYKLRNRFSVEENGKIWTSIFNCLSDE